MTSRHSRTLLPCSIYSHSTSRVPSGSAAADMDRERQARLLAEQLSRDARADADRALSDERARSQAQFLSQAQTASRLEARALALQERLDRLEAERLRVRIRERRAGGAGVGSRLRGNDGR